jgi:hypothetical protein
MAMSIRDNRKARPAQAGMLIGVRLQPEALSAVDAWISAQPDAPSRPEAIRRLVSTGLCASKRESK